MLRKTKTMKPRNLKVAPTHGLALTTVLMDSTTVIIADMDMDTVVDRTLAFTIMGRTTVLMDFTTVLTGVLKDSHLDFNLGLILPSLATHRKALLVNPVSHLRSKNL